MLLNKRVLFFQFLCVALKSPCTTWLGCLLRSRTASWELQEDGRRPPRCPTAGAKGCFTPPGCAVLQCECPAWAPLYLYHTVLSQRQTAAGPKQRPPRRLGGAWMSAPLLKIRFQLISVRNYCVLTVRRAGSWCFRGYQVTENVVYASEKCASQGRRVKLVSVLEKAEHGAVI